MKKMLLALLVLALAATGGWADVMAKDVILVGTESTYPPYEFRDEKNNLKGFDIDLMEAIAAKIGKKIEWVDMPFDSLIPSLLAKKIDIVAAGMSATEERAKKVAFSENYEISISAFIVKADNESMKVLDDMKGNTVAVQLGTVQETYSQTIPGVTVKSSRSSTTASGKSSSGGWTPPSWTLPWPRATWNTRISPGRSRSPSSRKSRAPGKPSP